MDSGAIQGSQSPVAAAALSSIDAHIHERIQRAIQDLRAEFDERLRKVEERVDQPAPPEHRQEPGNDAPAPAGTVGATVKAPPIEGIEGLSPNERIQAHLNGMIDVTAGQHKTEDQRAEEQAKADAQREDAGEEAETEKAPQTLNNEGVASVGVQKDETRTGEVQPQQITAETAPALDAEATAERQQQE